MLVVSRTHHSYRRKAPQVDQASNFRDIPLPTQKGEGGRRRSQGPCSPSIQRTKCTKPHTLKQHFLCPNAEQKPIEVYEFCIVLFCLTLAIQSPVLTHWNIFSESFKVLITPKTQHLGGFKTQLAGYTIEQEIKLKISSSVFAKFIRSLFVEKLRSVAFGSESRCKIFFSTNSGYEPGREKL